MNQVPGKLLLWDTKTMKQQVLAEFLSFLSLLAENECLLFQCVGVLFLNYADFLSNAFLFPPSSFLLCHIQDKNNVSSCGLGEVFLFYWCVEVFLRNSSQ